MDQQAFNEMAKMLFIAYLSDNYSGALGKETKDKLVQIAQEIPERGYSLEDGVKFLIEGK